MLITLQEKMKLIAITGSIGCGKTTIAKICREQGYAVWDVDAWVRRLYFDKGFINRLSGVFPEVVSGEAVDKRQLRNIVFADNAKLKKLENLIHPYLKEYLKRQIHKYSQKPVCIFLDVALLYEMGWQTYCHTVIVADVAYDIQKMRVMQRDKVNAEDFDRINNVQLDNQAKKAMADIVINTDKPHNLLRLEIIDILQQLSGDDKC